MNTLRYRYATSDDLPLLARLNAQLIEEGADFGPADPVYLEQRMRRWLDSGRDHAVLFEDSHGRLLAYALYEEQAQEIYLRQFLVVDAARRNGIGRQAFRLLRSEIWSAHKRLTLEVLSSNRAGYRFWRSLGYRNCAVTLEIPPAPACGLLYAIFIPLRSGASRIHTAIGRLMRAPAEPAPAAGLVSAPTQHRPGARGLLP